VSNMPLWLQAALWGGIAGGALLLGSMIGYFFNLRQRIVAGVMAFGSGVLISALSFELMGVAYDKGGFLSTSAGFVLGAFIYTAANRMVSMYGAKHRKRSNLNNRLSAEEISGGGLAIAVGALIDGIPESIVIGLGMIEGGAVSAVAVAAVFISNVPEGLSSSVGMKNNGKKLSYILTIWGGIAVISAISSSVGYLFFQNAPVELVSSVMAVAAGAILAMIVDTMMPEAFEDTHDYAGLITVLGFLCAFMLDKI
jgi:zinc transporter, ZIP family